jgi:hypothetical protein
MSTRSADLRAESTLIMNRGKNPLLTARKPLTLCQSQVRKERRQRKPVASLPAIFDIQQFIVERAGLAVTL